MQNIIEIDDRPSEWRRQALAQHDASQTQQNQIEADRRKRARYEAAAQRLEVEQSSLHPNERRLLALQHALDDMPLPVPA